jgi:hypothetical protein
MNLQENIHRIQSLLTENREGMIQNMIKKTRVVLRHQINGDCGLYGCIPNTSIIWYWVR